MADLKQKPITHEELLSVIDQAAHEKQSALNLANRGIDRLPDQIGKLVNLRSLDVSHNKLKVLPESIGNLVGLRSLNLYGNNLASLPPSFGRLVYLQSLILMRNELVALPEFICTLAQLRSVDLRLNRLLELPESIGNLADLELLYLAFNQLTELPESIGDLIRLKRLVLKYNRLTALPPSIGKLRNLQELDLNNNQLTSLPDSIEALADLAILSVTNNSLTSLPQSLGKLNRLQSLYANKNQLRSLPSSLICLDTAILHLGDNPLDPALQSAYLQGTDSLRAYLGSLEEAEPVYEAKLLLVGEGGVGKTTLLRALTGKTPQNDEPTTHGVSIDVKAMLVPHPKKKGVKLQLNAWDFGGQEVYRVTHQFFFSRRAIYLLVWEPRKGVQASQVEDWLKLIRLRVGDDARVIIVSTHCRTGERIARIDKPVLMRDFGSMIVGFHEVDSLTDDPATGERVGISELRHRIADAAQNLEQMGMLLSRNWRQSRDQLLAIEEPCISYSRFCHVCTRNGLDGIATSTLAHLMHDLGYIVYYGDDDRLKNEVVLQPEWLTKAIGFVLEDRKTQEMDGILPDSRLKDVWWDHPFKGEPKYNTALYPFFLRLMEKYDVSYRLENGTASLVAQHVAQVRPALPWLPEEEPKSGNRRIAMVCILTEIPPGLVPWMIVRTHDYACELSSHRLHWQKGMFLRNKPHGEAMLELREHEFHIYTEAVWPEFFMNILRKTLQKLITDNWPGMAGRYSFAVPCRMRVEGKTCSGRFPIDSLRKFLEEGDTMVRCLTCGTRQDIVELLYGFEEIGLREQMKAIQARFDGLDSRVAYYVWIIMQAIASESKEGPRLFTLKPMDPDWKRKLFARRYQLRLWCEAEGCQHPVVEKDKGVYEFEAKREWVARIAPYSRLVVGLLKTALPIVAPAINVVYGEKTTENWHIEDELDLMKEATEKLLPDIATSDLPDRREGVLTDVERSGVLALHALIRELDPNQEKLGLRRIPTHTGEFRWLCPKHYNEAQPKIPEKID